MPTFFSKDNGFCIFLSAAAHAVVMAERREIKNLFIQLSGSVVSVLTGVSNWGKAVNCIYRHRGS